MKFDNKLAKPIIDELEEGGSLSESGAEALSRIHDFIDMYECRAFNKWSGCKAKTLYSDGSLWVPKNWVEFFQTEIARDSHGEHGLIVKDKVGLLRFNFWRASQTSMPTNLEEDLWIRTNAYPKYKYLKKVVNPSLKKEHSSSETVWAVTFGQEHELLSEPSLYDKELIYTSLYTPRRIREKGGQLCQIL
jgi:hypothetical protein